MYKNMGVPNHCPVCCYIHSYRSRILRRNSHQPCTFLGRHKGSKDTSGFKNRKNVDLFQLIMRCIERALNHKQKWLYNQAIVPILGEVAGFVTSHLNNSSQHFKCGQIASLPNIWSSRFLSSSVNRSYHASHVVNSSPRAWLTQWLAHQTRTQIDPGSIPVAGKINLLSKGC